MNDNITVNENANVTTGGTEVIIKDALIICQGGEIVGRLDARYDFKDLAPEYHQTALTMISRRTRLGMATWENLEQGARRLEHYEERLEKYNALTWWKKLTARKPSILDPENDEAA